MFTLTLCLFSWMVSEWSKCSVSCGSGWKQRHVSCQQLDARGEIKTLTASTCERRSRPRDTEHCAANNCPTWITSPWGKVRTNIQLATCAGYTLQKICLLFFLILCFSLTVFRKMFRPRLYSSEEICHLPTCQWLLVHRL